MNEESNFTGQDAAAKSTADAMATINSEQQLSSFSELTMPKAPVGASDILKKQFQSAMDTVQRTINRHGRGESNLAINPVLGQIPNGGLSSGILGLLKSGEIPNNGQQSQMPQITMPTSGVANPTTKEGQFPKSMTSTPIGGQVARANGVVMGSSMFGGSDDVAHYTRNGSLVALPKGIDLNDDNAVSAAIQDANSFLDRIERVKKMEEED